MEGQGAACGRPPLEILRARSGSFDEKREGSISCLCKIGQEKTAVLFACRVEMSYTNPEPEYRRGVHPVTETQKQRPSGRDHQGIPPGAPPRGRGLPEYPAADPGRKPPRTSAVRLFEHFDTKRLLVMGLTETTYVSGMSEERRRESFDRLLSYPVPALIYTRGIDPFPECMEMAQKTGPPCCAPRSRPRLL